MPTLPKKLKMSWPPPPDGMPLDSREWEEWKVRYAAWYADVWDSWALGAFQPATPVPGGSVPSIRAGNSSE